MAWGFYGRTEELRSVAQIIGRNRWHSAKMTGRRRIGKTTLIANGRVERVCLAPSIPDEIRKRIEERSYLVQDLNDLTAGL